MPNWIENVLKARVVTVNVIYTVIVFVFAFNATALPLFVLKYPKAIEPEIRKVILDFGTTGLISVVMFILGRLTAKSEKEEK